MKKRILNEMQTNELVDAYAQIGMLQYSALDDGKISKYNRLYDEKREIEEEMRGALSWFSTVTQTCRCA
jgi:hypothetical protein